MGVVLSDRHRRLTEQVADLQKQVEDMEKTMREIDGESTDMFDRTDIFAIDN